MWSFRQYSSGTDWSGGGAHQLGFTDSGNIYHRYGTLTSWGAWYKFLDSNNYNSYSPTLTGTGASGTWGISISGNAATATTATTATTLTSTQSNWPSTGVISNVVGLLAWKNYGTGHVLFDASQGTSPSGTSVNAFNPTYVVENNSTASSWGQPITLMGWNGSATYGVKVDYSRYSNTSGNATTATSATTATNQSGGTVNATSIQSSAGMGDSAGGRLTNVGGGFVATNSGAITGAIKIKLPQGYSNTMLRMTVRVYTYDGLSFDIYCGGYNYSGEYWVNTFAYMDTQSRDSLNVRFGIDGGFACIYIGELGTVWQYPQVSITDFQAGYNAYAFSQWNTGWAITFETAFAGVTATQVAYRPVTNNSGTWAISVSGNAATATTATNQSGGTVNATTGTFSSTVSAETYYRLTNSGTQVGIYSKYKTISGSGTDNTPTLFSETGLGLYLCPNGSATVAASLSTAGVFTATSFSGAGTGLTGTATSLSIGGNAATATNVAGFVQNAYTTYGNNATTTTKNGYYGILFGATTGNPNIMYDASGNGGTYVETVGWRDYYSVANACLAIGGTTTANGYKLYVNGSTFTSGAYYGDGTGLTGTATSLSIGGNAATATTAANGGVTSIVAGTNISISGATGAVTINSTASGGATITPTTTAGTYYIVGTTSTSGTLSTASISNTNAVSYNASTGALTAVSLVSSSDERLKTNWTELSSDFVDQLSDVKHGSFERISSGNREVGVAAQSLQTVLPEAVVEDQEGMLSVNYGGAALVAAIELAKEVKALRAEIAELKLKIKE